MIEYEFPECDFHHHLYDTLILLGAPKEIADLAKKCTYGITPKDIDRLRNFNIELLTKSKTTLRNLNYISIKPSE